MAAQTLLRNVALAVAFAAAAPCCVAASYTVTGKCVGTHDGDTITVLDSMNVQHKIRLAEIDAPELKQPHGQDAKQALSKMVFGKSVTVNVSTRDRYGREIGSVTVNGIDVNGSMVRYGWAHCYVAYKHRSIVEEYEAEAIAKKRGIWKDGVPIPAWNWRRGVRK